MELFHSLTNTYQNNLELIKVSGFAHDCLVIIL